jgi:hypothetical protein
MSNHPDPPTFDVHESDRAEVKLQREKRSSSRLLVSGALRCHL